MTVLFADVAGSTELAEATDPEEMRQLLGRYYALAKDVVSSHGGTLEKFIGDAVMVVFGLPVAHGDDAERALSAALVLRDRVRSDARLGERMPVRIGVNTGDVVADLGSTGDFLVTGDAVNVAARLQQAAEPWQIVCGERTMRAARDSFVFAAPETITAKGKRGGVRAAVLSGRVPKRRPRLPLIGRQSDLDQLELVARRVVTEGRPSLVSIIAPAGTGKSRLLEELLDRLPSVAPDAAVAIAQCLPYGQRLTYWPLRAMLFRLAGIADDASNDAARTAIRSWLAAGGAAEADRVGELLAATVGVGSLETSDRAALFGAWRIALEVAARDRALVLVFEDLHWSSDSLLDLVEYVMQSRSDLRALTIALARPELLDRRPAWGGGRRSYVSLALEPLADNAIASIVRHLLEASSPEVVDRVVARAEGNPFFATELVRALLDRVGTADDPAAVEAALATLPDTVQGTVLARLDLLAPAERRVLQLGAVLGRSFRARGVETLSPDLAGAVAGHLEDLIDKDLVRPTGADAVTFRHILIREVAYHTLPRSERAVLHAAAARWLESDAAGHEEAFAELIAYHYREAAGLASSMEAEAGREIAAKATQWLLRAAAAASAGAAHVEAERHLRAALALADPEAHPAIHERLGDVASSGGDAAESYRTARELLRERGPQDPSAELRLLAGELLWLTRAQGSVARRPTDEYIQTIVSEGSALLPQVSDERTIARFVTARAFIPFWMHSVRAPSEKDLVAADSDARRALEMAERLGDLTLQSAALDALGSVAGQRGDARTSREHALRRLAMGDSLDLVERIDAASVATWMCVQLGDLADAVRISGDLLPRVLPGQAPSWVLHLAAWRALALLLTGAYQDAVATGDRMRDLWVESGRPTAGYAMRGFEAAHAAAQAQGNAPGAERMREVMFAIDRAFQRETPNSAARMALVTGKPLREALDAALALREQLLPEIPLRLLSVAADRAVAPPPEVLEILAAAGLTSYPLVLAVAQRALGVSTGDLVLLQAARETFELCGAVPSAIRARIEAALVSADVAAVEMGLRALEALGDVEQVERYERRRA